METDVRSKFMPRLAERGLSLKSFDDGVLTLSYNPAADTGIERREAAGRDDLARYARDVLASLPGSEGLFPHVGEVAIDFDTP
jgi:hypothetical protein